MREQISSEMWEQINRFYLTVRGTTIDTIWRRQPHEFFRSVKEAIHFFQGLTDSTLGHAEGWQFIQAGRFLERGNAIATLLGAYYERSARQPASEADDRVADQTAQYLEWVGLLKSCTAFEAYCRVYTADVTPDRITELGLTQTHFDCRRSELLSQVVIQQAVLDLIDRALGFIGDLLEPPPDQDGAANMVADNPGLATLAAFQPG